MSESEDFSREQNVGLLLESGAQVNEQDGQAKAP